MSRSSSGSSRAESAVEPTRSQNSTVSCRRSASVAAAGSAMVLSRRKAAIRGEQLAPVADRLDTQIFEVVRRQLEEDLGIDGIAGERLLVLRQPQLSEPGRDVNRLHPPVPAGEIGSG